MVIQGASPETSHINFSTLEHIADALTELPSRTRYAFEMYRLHGVPQRTSPRNSASRRPWSTS